MAESWESGGTTVVIIMEGNSMKNHKFWAWAMVICLLMTIYTGYEHK